MAGKAPLKQAALNRRPSVGIERMHKQQREMDALERNHTLSKYLEKQVVGTAPEQQMDFDYLAKLVDKPGVIDIDNDFDDDIDDDERETCEIESAKVMEHIDNYTDNMMAYLGERRQDIIKLKAPPSTGTTPPTKERRWWNPFKQSNPVDVMTADESRLVESCAIFSAIGIMKGIWVEKAFEQVNHFRNIAMQIFPEDLKTYSTLRTDQSTIVSWLVRDEELISSPLKQVRFVATLITDVTTKWRLVNMWLIPADISITDK